jgi:uncharacterized damage-inducible protein DinB
VTAEAEFLRFSAEKLRQLCGRIEDCLGRLAYDQVWLRGSGNENAVGNLVLHLCGNVTQWIGSGVAGRPDRRERDAEFAARGDVQPAELAARIRAVVDDAVVVIRSLPPARLAERITVQKYDVTVMEAIYHVVEHFSMHTGQILFATKVLTGKDLGYYRHLSTPAHEETVP